MSHSQYQPGQVLPGTVYRVVRHLATGGMGSVYDVEDITVEKRYVLKTLHPNLVAREDLALRMRDEAKSLAKLQHPNIVDVVTAGVTSDAQKMPFYVMERLIGQNLRVVLEKTGVLHVPHAYRIAIDVADALEHAHENNIVHRDVKPENIFLHRNANGTTTTKLLDFGIVRLLDRKASRTHGKFIGTLRYASPEQVTGRKVGPATDIYSLAVVLFEMLAGRGPFDDAGDAYAIGAAHANAPPPPLSRFIRGVAPDVEQLVASALAKNPEERPRDCFAFASELRSILREEEASPRSATAVNLLTSASPSTHVHPVDSGPAPGGPTVQGMIPPSAVMSGQPSVIAGPPTTRAEGRADGGQGPISPIAPTLAAAGLVSYSPNVQVNAAPLPAAGAPPVAGGPPAAGGGIDRSAPTRASASSGATRRVAQND
ncbi:MAG: serine/threonine protein kinase, partial [Myxococcales bacterium]|nr:serine/threonine protein kinase [Myxococcales bacterium]